MLFNDSAGSRLALACCTRVIMHGLLTLRFFCLRTLQLQILLSVRDDQASGARFVGTSGTSFYTVDEMTSSRSKPNAREHAAWGCAPGC